MVSIHPRPRMILLRSDGDGGLDLTVTTSRSDFEVLPLSRAKAAELAARLTAWLAEKHREDEARAKS